MSQNVRVASHTQARRQGLSTLAGNGTCGGTDGPGTAGASLCNPSHVAVTPDGSRAIVAERLLDAGAPPLSLFISRAAMS